jgi:hypothetical protein
MVLYISLYNIILLVFYWNVFHSFCPSISAWDAKRIDIFWVLHTYIVRIDPSWRNVTTRRMNWSCWHGRITKQQPTFLSSRGSYNIRCSKIISDYLLRAQNASFEWSEKRSSKRSLFQHLLSIRMRHGYKKKGCSILCRRLLFIAEE